MSRTDAAPSGVVSGRSRVWQAILIAHIFAAAAWWWLMPHGFPVAHVRFLANTALPLLVALAGVIGCYGLEKGKAELAGQIIIAFVVGWTAALLGSWIIFPFSAGRFLLQLLGGVAVIWLAYFYWSPVERPKGRASAAAIMRAVLVGVMIPWTQQSPEPDTLPMDSPMPKFDSEKDSRSVTPLIQLSDEVQVLAAEGDVMARCGHLKVEIAPLLTFESRSPDRCWTIFASAADRVGRRRKLVGEQVADSNVLLSYAGDERYLLRVRVRDAAAEMGPRGCSIDAYSELDKAVYSHLNAYSTITIRGHRRLALSFSPCPTVHVAVEPTDYPVGRPARFAYLDAAGQFHVVEASSGEKGPFRKLGSGPLDRSDPLAITLFDEDKAAGTIVFSDWASQASVALSPTAGWGVPMNAIEFSRLGDAPDAAAEIWLTLAATSVGRGWDSVGHAAGTYRNRVRVEAAEEAK